MNAKKLTQLLSQPPLVSFIICTYRRPELLAKCLAGFIEQEEHNLPYEIIIVDNDSGESTERVVTEFKSKYYQSPMLNLEEKDLFLSTSENKHPHISTRILTQPNLSVARNLGAEHARGEWLVYIDDDAIPNPRYIKYLHHIIRKYKPDIVGGPVYPIFTGKLPSWYTPRLETKEFEKKSGFSKTRRITGANFGIRKDVLTSLGGFDPKRGMQADKLVFGDDRQVVEKYHAVVPELQKRIFYVMECSIQHHVSEGKVRFGYICKRYFLGGVTSVIIDIEHGVLRKKIEYYLQKNISLMVPLFFTVTIHHRVFQQVAVLKKALEVDRLFLIEWIALFCFESGRIVAVWRHWFKNGFKL